MGNMLLIHVRKWINLKCILLNKRKEAQRLHIVSFHSYDKMESKTTVTENISVVVQGFRKGGKWLNTRGYILEILCC